MKNQVYLIIVKKRLSRRNSRRNSKRNSRKHTKITVKISAGPEDEALIRALTKDDQTTRIIEPNNTSTEKESDSKKKSLFGGISLPFNPFDEKKKLTTSDKNVKSSPRDVKEEVKKQVVDKNYPPELQQFLKKKKIFLKI